VDGWGVVEARKELKRSSVLSDSLLLMSAASACSSSASWSSISAMAEGKSGAGVDIVGRERGVRCVPSWLPFRVSARGWTEWWVMKLRAGEEGERVV